MKDRIALFDRHMIAHPAQAPRPTTRQLSPLTGGPRIPVVCPPRSGFDSPPDPNLRVSDLLLIIASTEEAQRRTVDAKTIRALAKCFAEGGFSEAFATLGTWTGSGRCDRCADLS